MMRPILYVILFLSTFTSALSQGTLTLENGKRVAYEKLKIGSKYFQITRIDNGKKIKENILIDSIKSYQEVVTIYYKKPAIDQGIQKYDFVTREVIGKINVYQKSSSTSYSAPGQFGGGYSVTREYLYLEKGDRYERIDVSKSILIGKKEKIQILKSFIGDDPEILAKLENDDSKLGSDDIIKLIKSYNLNSYRKKN